MSLLGMMDETCSVLRPNVEQNDDADTERTFVPLYAAVPVPCSVQLKRPSPRSAQDGGFVQKEKWIGFFMPDADIRVGDRIQTDKGTTYDVAGLDLVRYDHWEAELRPVADQ